MSRGCCCLLGVCLLAVQTNRTVLVYLAGHNNLTHSLEKNLTR